MRRLKESAFSSAYSVRLLDEQDIPIVFSLCAGNEQFYAWCGKPFSDESIRRDLNLLPPGKAREDKYYVGFFVENRLCAVLDLIDGYPDDAAAFIGFFMMEKTLQGAGRGTAIITALCAYLKNMGIERVQLGIDRDNPQSTYFWKKNGFASIREINQGDGVIILAQKTLNRKREAQEENTCSEN